MTTVNVADLVPFSTGCARLGIPLPSAERYLRSRPGSLPPMHRIGWERYFTRSDLERSAAERSVVASRLQLLAEVLALAACEKSLAKAS